MGITASIASVALNTDFKKLPRKVVDTVKHVVLDSVGCALGGTVTDRARIALRIIARLGGCPQATVITGARTSLPLATFANSELMNALDFDAIGPLTGHVVPNTLPTCLALAEFLNASGKELITSVALGLEIGGRIASSLGHHRIPKEEWPYFEWAERFSYSPTIFGAIAGGVNLLKLGELQARNALGLAGICTPVAGGTKFEYTAPNMAKYNAWSGHIASLATMALLFAESGFTSDTSIFDGERGFWKMYGAPVFKENVITGGLGTKWHLDAMEFKPYPACRGNHSSVDAIRQIMGENHLEPQDVEAIAVHGDAMLLKPLRTGQNVENYSDTQFLNRYIFALACFSRWYKPGPSWQLPSAYDNTQVREMMEKVTVEEHPRLIEMLREKLKVGTKSSVRNALVEITARGTKFSMEVAIPRGSRENPLTTEELCDKFMTNASYSPLNERRCAQAMEMLLNLEQVEGIRQLAETLGG